MENLKELHEKLAQYERKEKELERSEARLRMAMESTGLGTWDFNPLTSDLTWSDECKKIYGLASDKTVNFETFADHIYPEDKEHVEQEIQRSMDPTGGGNYDIIYRIIRFDNNDVRWIRAQGKVYLNKQGQTDRFIGTVIDITDIKHAEEKSAKLAAIIESSDDAIISKTLDGIITSWNNSAGRIFGYTADEIIGQPILKLIPLNRQDEEPQIISRLKSGERVDHFETKRVTKTGALLDISLTISPVKDSQGNIIGVSKIARDITEKKQEEQRKNDFIAMVSHELKTPLTSMKAYLQVLLAIAKKDGNEFRINALTRADIQAKKMTTMIQDFLSLARLEEGKIPLNKTLFDLHSLIEETAGDAKFLTSIHMIQIDDCEEITLNADRDKIGQVLLNLLSNAIKYSPKGGAITIGCEKQADTVKIYVRDEGVGIDPEDQKRLFERFYRAKNETLKTISGFGIGLYLVSEILRYHNTKIEVQSTEGIGSVFYFSLALV
jgi:two-component system sensor histidine kinase VicK